MYHDSTQTLRSNPWRRDAFALSRGAKRPADEPRSRRWSSLKRGKVTCYGEAVEIERPGAQVFARHITPKTVFLAFLALTFLAMACWSFADPLVSAPDEQAHLIRAYAIDHGQLGHDSAPGDKVHVTVTVPTAMFCFRAWFLSWASAWLSRRSTLTAGISTTPFRRPARRSGLPPKYRSRPRRTWATTRPSTTSSWAPAPSFPRAGPRSTP